MATTFHFCDGAEVRDISWASSSNASPTSSATNPATGDRSYLCDLNNADELHFDIVKNGLDAATALSDTFVLIGFKVRPTDNTDDGIIFSVLDNAGSQLAALRYTHGLSQMTVFNKNTLTEGNIAYDLPLNEWTRIELAFEISTTGIFEAWVNGISELSSTGDFDRSTSNAAQIKFGRHSIGIPAIVIQIDDIYVMSDNIAQPTPLGDWRVEAFQAGTGATITGTADTGSVTEVDELPPDGATTELVQTSASTYTMDCDAAGTAQAGPNASSQTGVVKLGVWHTTLIRTNGAARTAIFQYGNASGGEQSTVNLDAVLTTGYQDFFYKEDAVGTAAGNCPDGTTDLSYAWEKSGSSGRTYSMSSAFGQVLFQNDAAAASPFIKKSLRRRLRKVF